MVHAGRKYEIRSDNGAENQKKKENNNMLKVNVELQTVKITNFRNLEKKTETANKLQSV